jgi:hypothetical protein
MKKTLSLLLALSAVITAAAQSPYKGTFLNKELNIRAHINLEARDIPVPGMEDLDSCYGYFQGNLNGSWYILRVKQKDEKKAVVRAACDRGDNAQDLEIRPTADGLSIKQVGDNYMRGIAKRKYVRLPKPFYLTKE